MSPRILFTLPYGNYFLKSDSREYVLSKNLGYGGTLIYMLREKSKLDAGTIFFREEEDYVFDEPSRNGYYKQRRLSSSAIISGLHIRGDKSCGGYDQLKDLSFIPKTTFKNWEQSLNNN